MLKPGDRGDAVKQLQEKLVEAGTLTPEQMATGPGVYGPRTESAVKAYKATIVDGVADDYTLSKLGLQTAATTSGECPSPGIVTNGVIDISHHNDEPDFAALRGAGIVGVIHKATQGTGYVDPTYESRRVKAIEAGILWGAYHFATGADPVAQADHFLKTAAPNGDTLLVLDFEANPMGTSMDLAGAEAFVSHIVAKTGKAPGFYSGNDIKEQLGTAHNEVLAQCWFWLAQYGSPAVTPPNWSRWTMWQYTDGNLGPDPHEVPGYGPCDRDKFNGSEEELVQFWQEWRV